MSKHRVNQSEIYLWSPETNVREDGYAEHVDVDDATWGRWVAAKEAFLAVDREIQAAVYATQKGS